MLSDGPLSKWQRTENTKEDVKDLISSLNRVLVRSHDQTLLEGNFEARWPALHEKLNEILAASPEVMSEFLQTDIEQLSGTKLTSESRILLKEASKDSAGAINFIRTDGGDFIMVNGKEFGGESARDQAIWRDAFYDLKRHDFFEQKSKEYFVLTTKGFRIADKL